MLTLERCICYRGKVALARDSARAHNPSPSALSFFLSFSSPDGHDARSVATFVRPRSIELSSSSLIRCAVFSFVASRSRSSPLSRRHTHARIYIHTQRTYSRPSPSLPPCPSSLSTRRGEPKTRYAPGIPSRTGNTSRLARRRESVRSSSSGEAKDRSLGETENASRRDAPRRTAPRYSPR